MERFLSAAVMEQAGRLEDAKVWYAGVFDTNLHDRVFWAPAHVRLGRVNEALGDITGARRQYTEAVSLLTDAEPPYLSILQEARSALARLGS